MRRFLCVHGFHEHEWDNSATVREEQHAYMLLSMTPTDSYELRKI